MFCLTEPEPPIKLEKMEETTNKISLALEIQEDGVRTKPGMCFNVTLQEGADRVSRMICEMND